MMKICILIGILLFLSISPIAAQEATHSVGESVGKIARNIHDSAVDTSRIVRTVGHQTSDWFVDHLATVGDTMSGTAKDIARQFDLFTYSIRQGYENNQ